MTIKLDVQALNAGYGPISVLHEVSLNVAAGEIVVLLGANGAGKSTLMQSLVGLVRPSGGGIAFDGKAVAGLATEQVVRRGLTLVPEGRRIFAKLTVADNLRMGAYSRHDRAQVAADLERLLERFPILAARKSQRAGTLSGGEQQQLAICRALMSKPTMILLDEPSLGLAPVMADRVFALVSELRDQDGLTVLLVEQSISHALEIADRAYVMSSGRIVASGTSAQISDTAHELEQSYLGGTS